MLLSKITYRQVIKKLDFYRQQHLEDREENPSAIPPAWGCQIEMMIEETVRSNHERCHKGLAKEVMEYLVEKGILVRYAGDYTFPTDERLPSKEEIKSYTNKLLKKLGRM